MKINEYIASEGKGLLNIDDFSFGIKILTKYDLSIIEVSLEDGKYFNTKYSTSIKELDDDEEKIANLKNLLKEELVFKGYDLNNLVEPIIHN